MYAKAVAGGQEAPARWIPTPALESGQRRRRHEDESRQSRRAGQGTPPTLKDEQTQGAASRTRSPRYDYDGVILSLVKKYCPPGLLGLALTALLASFMSGMAGNVTAFNTVWTYDLYQAYIAPNKSDEHYLWMGQRDHGGRHPVEHRLRLLRQSLFTTRWTSSSWCSVS